jgi:hypothetical protein
MEINEFVNKCSNYFHYNNTQATQPTWDVLVSSLW